MHVEGITWHAVTLQAGQFGATKKLLTEVFGLTPAIEEEGWTLFPMSNGTIHGEQEILGGPLGCRTVFAEAASSGSKAARRYRGFAVGEVHGRKMDL